MPNFEMMFYTLFFATVIGGIVYGLFFKVQSRVKAFRRLAEHLETDFSEDGAQILNSTLTNLPLFQVDGKTFAKPLLSKEQGSVELAVFDFHCLSEDVGEGSGVESLAVVAVKTPRFETPAVIELCPNCWITRAMLADFLPIELVGFPKFSRQYLVRGTDSQTLSELFDAEQIQFFEQLCERRLMWRIEIGHGWVMCFQIAARSPTKLERIANEAWRVFGRSNLQGTIAELQESSSV